MKILDRYLVREMSGPFAFGVLAFVLLFVSANVLFELAQVISELGISLWTASELFLLRLPRLIVYTFPLATLVAILVTFGRLGGDSEIVAMHAGGVSFRRLVAPMVAVGLIVSLAAAAFNEYVVPAANRRAEGIVREANARAGKMGQENVYLRESSKGQTTRLIYAERLDVQTGEMSRPTITWFEKGRPVMVTVAERGRWSGSKWEMLRGVNHLLESEWPTTWPFAQWTTEFGTSPRQIAQQARNPSEMTYRELKEYIRYALRQDQPTAEAELRLHHIFSIPFASLVFALVAAPLGLRSHRGGSAIGLGIAILIGFGYYVIWNYLAILAQEGGLSPLWAAWLPNLVTGAIGVALILRVRK